SAPPHRSVGHSHATASHERKPRWHVPGAAPAPARATEAPDAAGPGEVRPGARRHAGPCTHRFAPMTRPARWAAGMTCLVALQACETVQGGASPETPLWARHPSGAMQVVVRRQVTVPERLAGEEFEHGRP